MKLTSQTLGPDVVDSRTQVQDGTVALTNYTQRLQHVVQNSSVGKCARQFAAYRIKPAVDPQRRVDLRLAMANPLLVSPVEASNGLGARIMAIVAQDEFSGDTSHAGIFKVADQ